MTPSRPPVELRTDRLRLRQWREDDRDRFAALNADPRVMEFFPAPLDRAGSDAMLDRLRADVAARGWGLWAVEIVDGGALAGFVGLSPLGADLPPAPGSRSAGGWRRSTGGAATPPRRRPRCCGSRSRTSACWRSSRSPPWGTP